MKYGLDPQEERLKNGERLPQEDWGYDMRDGVLTRVEGEERVEETLLTVPGNYPAYYAAIRDALNGDGENPVPASQAIQVMDGAISTIHFCYFAATFSRSARFSSALRKAISRPLICAWRICSRDNPAAGAATVYS